MPTPPGISAILLDTHRRDAGAAAATALGKTIGAEPDLATCTGDAI